MANKLSLNIDKTGYILFRPRAKLKARISIDLTINGLKIKQLTSCKYLGIIIDEQLKWTEHIDYVYKKIIKFTGIFYRMRDKMLDACLKNLYFALVYPHVLFGIELYANTYKSHLERLLVLNNKLLRIMQRAVIFAPVVSLYVKYNTLPIDLLFKRQLLLLMHKYMHYRELLPFAFHNYFVQNQQVHSHETRARGDLHMLRFNTCFGQKCITYQASVAWNIMPSYLKVKLSEPVFKKSTYKYLLTLQM